MGRLSQLPSIQGNPFDHDHGGFKGDDGASLEVR